MLGFIGGTGFAQLNALVLNDQRWYDTPFGGTSGPVNFGTFEGVSVVFMARHGDPHKIPPHLVNYRANLHALRQAGVSELIAINAVGGIHSRLGPAQLAIPDQIIDYTYGREHSIYDGVHCETVDHIDFTSPYSEHVRQGLIAAAKRADQVVFEGGVYGATQGPRLETAAEIKRYQRDGCDMVGMTGMPEAALARELGLECACIALSANWAAGLGKEKITMDDIRRAVSQGAGNIHQIISGYVSSNK